jgi:hypothetical protein
VRIFSLGVALAGIVSIGVIMQSCNSEDLLAETLDEKPEFPSYADNYGKAVAKELRNTVENLNKMGVDYSNADNSAAFKEQFYENLYKVNPVMANSKDVVNNMPQVNPIIRAEKIRNLTAIQLEFIQRITKECNDSKSYQELSQRLIKISEDIYSEVPKVQQERLFNVTAVLYYGVNEIQSLEKQGQMLSTPQNSMQRVRLKSGGESGGNTSGSCRNFLATVWAIAICEPTPAGEIVAAVATIIVGGILLYEVTVCNSSSYSSSNIDCSQKYSDCIFAGLLASWKCYDCFAYCQGQNVWDCPRPY